MTALQRIKFFFQNILTVGKNKTGSQGIKDAWQGRCSICGYTGRFERAHKSIREGYACPVCKASLRYRHQAEIILETYSHPGISTFKDLAGEPGFKNLSIYEPGIIGPFRKYLKTLPLYQQSCFWPAVAPGEIYRGIRCENLEDLTFADQSFDLVITSDIFEHIRKPFSAFKEVFRVLKPGGYHIFTVPMAWPLPAHTEYRIDTSGPVDRYIKDPVYHGSPVDKKGSLVYTDFGMDLLDMLRETGFENGYRQIKYNLTFFSAKRV